jgi:hypothetical protein
MWQMATQQTALWHILPQCATMPIRRKCRKRLVCGGDKKKSSKLAAILLLAVHKPFSEG